MNPVILCGKNEAFTAFLRRALPENTPLYQPDSILEGLRLAKDRMNEKNVYFMNPSFDR